MKKIAFLFVIAAIFAACKTKAPEPHFVIQGKISGADSVTFYLQKRVPGKYIKLDSAIVLKGKFTMTGGKVEYPDMVLLISKDMKSGKQFFLENSEITINGKLDSLYQSKVTGSKTQAEYDSLQKLLEPANKKYSELDDIYSALGKSVDKAKKEEFEDKFDSLDKVMNEIEETFVKNNPKSFVCPNILRNLAYSLEATEIESLIMAMDTSVSKTQIVKDLMTRVVVMKTVAVGQKAPDFTLNDVNDKPVSLYSRVGKSKLLLIDFWASWCGPCRRENPNVVKVWKDFHSMGFDVFGVSLDRPGTKDKWVKAIKDDKLTWTHVSDLKYWDCAAAKLYAVNGIPANYLLDEKGTVLKRNLSKKALYNFVKEKLAKK